MSPPAPGNAGSAGPVGGGSLTPTDPAPSPVVDPTTGELLDLDAPTDRLAEVTLALKAREQQLKDWRQLIEAELLERLGTSRRRKVVVGDFELEVAPNRGRVWDPDDLEACVQELRDAGTLSAAEVGGLITTAPKVDGKLAAALLTRLTGSARDLLERCYRWEARGKPRLQVTRSIPFLPPSEERPE